MSSRFGTLIRTARRARHLTLEQLAEKAGQTVEIISAIEDGAASDEQTKIALADTLRLDRQAVLDLPDDYDDGPVVLSTRRQPQSEQEIQMLKATMDFAFANLDPEYPTI